MLLQARGLTAVRPGDGGDNVVLRDVDLDVEAGTLTDVIGPSGSGKTTLLLTLARLIPGAAGSLALDGVDASQVGAAEWRTRVAYLPQSTRLGTGTVAESLSLPWRLRVRRGAAEPQVDALRDALDRVGMDDVALDRDVARLSVGQAARVALLRVLLAAPSVLLLDEPDASLDDASAAAVTRMTADFAASGGGVVRVRHARVDAHADRRLRLADGKLEEAADHA